MTHWPIVVALLVGFALGLAVALGEGRYALDFLT
jgi:hypothetical protein